MGRPVFQEGMPGRQPLGLPRPRFTVVGGAGVTRAGASGVGPWAGGRAPRAVRSDVTSSSSRSASPKKSPPCKDDLCGETSRTTSTRAWPDVRPVSAAEPGVRCDGEQDQGGCRLAWDAVLAAVWASWPECAGLCELPSWGGR